MWLVGASIVLLLPSSAIGGPMAILDMTHLVDNRTEVWVGQTFPKLKDVTAAINISDSWRANDFFAGEHVGTHIDAPRHRRIPGAKLWLHEMKLENMYGKAVRIDVREKVEAAGSNYAISVEDLTDFEAAHGRIPDGAMVFTCTGWGEKYGKDTLAYWGHNPNNPDDYQWSFPSFSGEAARWLVSNRDVKGVGVDVPSCDLGTAVVDVPVHDAMLGTNRWCMEHVAKTCELPYQGATVYAFANKVEGGSASPVRVVAMWSTGTDDHNGATTSSVNFLVVTSAILLALMNHL